jgi:nucleotide-binding universal stress UspA family protein
MNQRPSCVLAGVSLVRSALSEHIVGWAADEAAARHLPLRLVHAQEWPRGASAQAGPDHPAYAWSSHFRASGEALLQDALDVARARHPALTVSTELAAGRPVHVLREAAEAAALLVLGTRRFTGLEGTFAAGDKGEALTGHLSCPLALVPPPSPDTPVDAPVVVGVDGSAASRSAVDFAFAEAAAWRAVLVAVHVRKPRDAAWPEFLEESTLELSELVAGHREQYPDTEVRHEILTGEPGHMLAAAARYARCLVVGSRGRGGFRGMLLGSTSRALVHHTHCPLIVTPTPQSR